MILEFLEFLYYTVFLGLGYVIPITLAAVAFVSNDKTRMSRWLIHFLIINVLEYTFFPIFNFIGLSFLSQTLGVIVLFLPTFYSFESLVALITENYNNAIDSKLEGVRHLTLQGLQKFNLA